MEVKQINLDKILNHPPLGDELVTTTEGLIRAGDLIRTIEEYEDGDVLIYKIRYYLNKEEVHKSIHVQIKKGVEADAVAASF